MRPIPPWRAIAFEIVSHIDPGDTATLLACSLTHSTWTLAAQRRLYHKLRIRSRHAMRRWHEFDADNKFTPYVRHLIYYGDEINPLRPRDLLGVYGSRLLRFDKLDTLEIRFTELERFDLHLFRLSFGHLGGTLKALHICDATMTLSKILGLISLFPRLKFLGLARFQIGRESPAISSSRPSFRGTLSLSGPVDKRGLRFIMDLTRMLLNFSSVRVRLNLSYHVTRRLLEIPGFANNVTTMLLGCQDGTPEHIDLSRCYNLRTLSVRTEGQSQRFSSGLNTKEILRLFGTITSRELESIIVGVSSEPSLMWHRMWGQFFKVLQVLQASSERLSVVIGPSYEEFMAENFKKGEILARFLGCN